MSPQAIEGAIREAYRYSEVAATHGDTVVLRGSGAGYTIEMWLNRATGMIESAYPLP